MSVATTILGLLTALPSMLSAGREIVGAVTGEDPPPEAVETPEALAAHIESLPADMQAQIRERLIRLKERLQELDTTRFLALTEGDAEKVRATARPEIALQAMSVIALFGNLLKWLGMLAILQWGMEVFIVVTESTLEIPTVWDQLAKLAPVSELIWGPLVASFVACTSIITKYMGCRERDKAQQYEMVAGRPLESAQATIEAAAGGVASLIRAFRN